MLILMVSISMISISAIFLSIIFFRAMGVKFHRQYLSSPTVTSPIASFGTNYANWRIRVWEIILVLANFICYSANYTELRGNSTTVLDISTDQTKLNQLYRCGERKGDSGTIFTWCDGCQGIFKVGCFYGWQNVEWKLLWWWSIR